MFRCVILSDQLSKKHKYLVRNNIKQKNKANEKLELGVSARKKKTSLTNSISKDVD